MATYHKFEYDAINNTYVYYDESTRNVYRVPTYIIRDYQQKGTMTNIDGGGFAHVDQAELEEMVREFNSNGTIYQNNRSFTYSDNTSILPPGPTGAQGAPYHDATVIDFRSRMFTLEEQKELLEVKESVSDYLYKNWREGFIFHDVVVAGGCFASLLNKEPVKDYDVFLLSNEFNHQVAKNLAKKSPGLDNIHVGNSNYMKNDKIEQTIFLKKEKIQYITSRYTNREDLINHFDFKHCCVSYDFIAHKLYITREVYDLIKSKTLVPTDENRKPELWRYEKFIGRGWKSNPEAIPSYF